MTLLALRGDAVAMRDRAAAIGYPLLGQIEALIAVCDELLPGVPPPALPAWTLNRAPFVIAPIPGTKWGAIKRNGGPLYWTSRVICPDGWVRVVAGGGHGSDTSTYGDNGGTGLNLNLDAPNGAVLLHPRTSDANATPWNVIDTLYQAKPYRVHYPADPGKPPMRPESHSYYTHVAKAGQFCFDGKSRIVMLGLLAPRHPVGGTMRPRQVDGATYDGATMAFDTPVDDAVPLGFAGSGTSWADLPPAPGGFKTVNVAASDPRNGHIYFASGRFVARMDTMQPGGAPVSLYGNGGPWTAPVEWLGWHEVPIFVDPVRNRLVSIRGAYRTANGAPAQAAPNNVDRIEWFNLGAAAPALQITPATGFTNLAPVPSSSWFTHVPTYSGACYSPKDDRYYVWISAVAGSTNVREELIQVHPDTGAVQTVATYPLVGVRGPLSGFEPAFGGLLACVDRPTALGPDVDMLFCPLS